MGEGTREARLDDYRRARGARLYGWSVDGTVVCVAGVSVAARRGELLHIASAPAVERRGHAQALVYAVMEELGLDYPDLCFRTSA